MYFLSVFDMDNHCAMCSASKPPGSGPTTTDWVSGFHYFLYINDLGLLYVNIIKCIV